MGATTLTADDMNVAYPSQANYCLTTYHFPKTHQNFLSRCTYEKEIIWM